MAGAGRAREKARARSSFQRQTAVAPASRRAAAACGKETRLCVYAYIDTCISICIYAYAHMYMAGFFSGHAQNDRCRAYSWLVLTFARCKMQKRWVHLKTIPRKR